MQGWNGGLSTANPSSFVSYREQGESLEHVNRRKGSEFLHKSFSYALVPFVIPVKCMFLSGYDRMGCRRRSTRNRLVMIDEVLQTDRPIPFLLQFSDFSSHLMMSYSVVHKKWRMVKLTSSFQDSLFFSRSWVGVQKSTQGGFFPLFFLFLLSEGEAKRIFVAATSAAVLNTTVIFLPPPSFNKPGEMKKSQIMSSNVFWGLGKWTMAAMWKCPQAQRKLAKWKALDWPRGENLNPVSIFSHKWQFQFRSIRNILIQLRK